MIRKLILAALPLALATAAQAETRTGPYVGAGVTVDSVNAEVDGIDSVGSTGIGGSAFAGYNIAFGNGFFVSPEASINLNTTDADFTAGGDTLRLDGRWGWGVGGRAGYDISGSTAAYVRGGYERSQYRLREDTVSDRFWLDGVRVGGGLETEVAPHLRLRAEYGYINYERDFSDNQGLLGLVYTF